MLFEKGKLSGKPCSTPMAPNVQCYSIVELETSWKNESCIHVELGNFIFFLVWFVIVLYINKWFVINETNCFSFNHLLLHGIRA